MRFFIFILFIAFNSCSSTSKIYICGDRECLDKKEMKEYYAKYQIIEIRDADNEKTIIKRLLDIFCTHV